MAKRLSLFLLLVLSSVPCYAETPAWEIFGGYSFQRAGVRLYYKTSPIIYTFKDRYINMNGWEVSATENLNPWFGGTLQLTGHYNTPTVTGSSNSLSSNREHMFSMLYGPRFSYRASWATLFGQALFGAGHVSVAVIPTGPHASDTTFEAAVGGGFDINLGKTVAARVLQVQYSPTNHLDIKRAKFQASAGIVLNLGERR